MHCSAERVQPWTLPGARGRAGGKLCPLLWRILPIITVCVVSAPWACGQDSGSEAHEFHGRGVEITVNVRDASGEALTSEAVVKILRDGNFPSAQGETTRGQAVLVVYSTGEFTIVVRAAGYQEAQKELSLNATGRAQVDVLLRKLSAGASPSGVPGRPLLAPKAKKAIDRALEALSADKVGDAEKDVNEAMRLAPGHPDVLYVEGVVRLKQRKWEDAQAALEKATQIDPTHARAFAALGMALCDEGKFDAAIAPLEKSLQLDTAAGWDTRWTLAKAYYRRQQYNDALRMAQEARESSYGKAPELEMLVAQVLTALGRYEEAADVLRNVVKERGDSREAATAERWLEQLTAGGKIKAN